MSTVWETRTCLYDIPGFRYSPTFGGGGHLELQHHEEGGVLATGSGSPGACGSTAITKATSEVNPAEHNGFFWRDRTDLPPW